MVGLDMNDVPRIIAIIVLHLEMLKALIIFTIVACIRHKRRSDRKRVGWRMYDRHVIRSVHVRRITYDSDLACKENTRMDRRSFHILCDLLKTRGKLSPTKNMCVEEMVAMFLHICAHDVKNRIIKRQFVRSGETISRQFGKVLNSLLRLQDHLLKKPEPIREDSTNYAWKWFKNCLGALDGTYIKVNARAIDRPRYRTRKGDIATNVLGVCSQDMQFIYILPGWEGSAADSRVLRDAISRRNGLIVPQGKIYKFSLI